MRFIPILTLLVGIALTPQTVSARAFASAVIDVRHIVWYQDDGDGAVDPCSASNAPPCDVPLTASPTGKTPTDLRLVSSSDSVALTRALNGSGQVETGSRNNTTLATQDVDLPQTCDGSDCDLAAGEPYPPNDYAPPPSTPSADTQYSYADSELTGYFADVFDIPGGSVTGGGTIAVRLDNSLPGPTDATVQPPEPATAVGQASIVSTGNFTVPASASEDFNTYFEIEFVAKSVVLLTDGEQTGSVANAVANLSINAFSFGFGDDNNDGIPDTHSDVLPWTVVSMTHNVDGEPGNSTLGSDSVRTLNSFDATGGDMFTLRQGDQVTLNIAMLMTVNATASSTPSPATAALMLPGLAVLAWRLRRRTATP